MTSRASLESMQQRISGKVKGGVVVLDDAVLADGTSVTVLVEQAEIVDPPDVPIEFDAKGDVIMTPELEADIAAAIAESDRGEGTPWETVRAEIFGKR